MYGCLAGQVSQNKVDPDLVGRANDILKEMEAELLKRRAALAVAPPPAEVEAVPEPAPDADVPAEVEAVPEPAPDADVPAEVEAVPEPAPDADVPAEVVLAAGGPAPEPAPDADVPAEVEAVPEPAPDADVPAEVEAVPEPAPDADVPAEDTPIVPVPDVREADAKPSSEPDSPEIAAILEKNFTKLSVDELEAYSKDLQVLKRRGAPLSSYEKLKGRAEDVKKELAKRRPIVPAAVGPGPDPEHVDVAPPPAEGEPAPSSAATAVTPPPPAAGHNQPFKDQEEVIKILQDAKNVLDNSGSTLKDYKRQKTILFAVLDKAKAESKSQKEKDPIQYMLIDICDKEREAKVQQWRKEEARESELEKEPHSEFRAILRRSDTIADKMTVSDLNYEEQQINLSWNSIPGIFRRQDMITRISEIRTAIAAKRTELQGTGSPPTAPLVAVTAPPAPAASKK
jgi:hypothetical protein